MGLEFNEFSTITLILIFFTIMVWFISWFIDFRYKNNRIYQFLSNVQFRPGLPIIGNINLFLGKKQCTEYLKEYSHFYNTNYGLWFGFHPILVLLEVEDIQTTLLSTHCVNKSFFSEELGKLFGDGILTSEAIKHRKLRKIIQPAFNLRNLKTYLIIFNEETSKLLETLSSVNENWFRTFAVLSLDILKRTIFGLKNDSSIVYSVNSEDLIKNMNIAEELIFKKMITVTLHNNFLFQLSGLKKIFDESMNIVKDYTSTILNYNKQIKLVQMVENEGKEVFKGMVELLLENSEISDQNILDECQQILAAGIETSATSLCNFFSCMGVYQNIQEKVFEEIIDVIGYDAIPNVENISKLNFLDRCLKETLRLMAPIAYIGRTVTGNEVQLSHFVAPVDATILIDIEFVHRSPKYWKNPDKFDPDRFLPEEVAKRHPFAFMPFAAGARKCIGDKYIMLFQKCAIVNILRKYKCYCKNESLDDLQMQYNIVSRAKEYFFYFKKRE